ncbi:MAG: DinB family protein [Desulfobacteraceae bacterium]|nr:DinB family protein [Desulfobacteraceae bacterium]MBC2752507.1 DinB family protein [Desulfobacteraceae bacterium]
MTTRQTNIIAILRSSTDETVQLYAELSPEQLQTPVYSEEVQWTVRQVLAHLITIEKTMHWLFRNILDGGPGSPDDFDVARFNRTQPQKLDHLSLQQLLQRFKTVREETIAIVAGMADADFDRKGWHVFLGHDRLERFIRWAYEHARLHEDDIRRAIAPPL